MLILPYGTSAFMYIAIGSAMLVLCRDVIMVYGK